MTKKPSKKHEEVIKRLKKEGHFVRVATKHGFSNWQRHVDHDAVDAHPI